jgi:hypothetical protein
VQAARKEEVLNALSQIAGKFRTRVGESLTMIEKHSIPIEEATTSSLEAWRAYTAGSITNYAKGYESAIRISSALLRSTLNSPWRMGC